MFSLPRTLRLVWLFSIAAVVIGSLASAHSPLMQLLDCMHLNDKFEHFTAYAVLAGLPTVRRFRCRHLFAMVALLFLLGGALELAQLFSPGRSCDGHDLLANSCGILAGMALVRSFQKGL